MITDNNQLSEIDRSILLTDYITLTPGVAACKRIVRFIIIILLIIIPGSHKKNPPIKLIISGFDCLLLKRNIIIFI